MNPFETQKTIKFVFLSGALLESIQNGRNPRLRVAILYFSSILFSILLVSFFIDKEIDGASAGVFGLIGGHLGMLYDSMEIPLYRGSSSNTVLF